MSSARFAEIRECWPSIPWPDACIYSTCSSSGENERWLLGGWGRSSLESRSRLACDGGRAAVDHERRLIYS